MDFFDIEFPELPSIAPDLMFEEEPIPVRTVFSPALTTVERESLTHLVLDDHDYARPYPVLSTGNKKCVTPHTILKLHASDTPVKNTYKKNQSKYQSQGSEDEDIDVCSVDKQQDYVVRYDKTKAHNGMNEVESYLNSLWKDVNKDDDEKITRGSWSKEQARLFDVVYKLINNYQLAKLTYFKNTNEPVLRKLALDKATKRIRKAFGSVLWNPKYIVWLHGIMIDGLGSSLFLCYLEILQSLKRKAPTLFERVLLFDRGASEKEHTAGLPNLAVRLKKSWDPSTGLQSKVTMDKFPTTPFLIMVPSGPSIPHQSTKRNRFWNNQLTNFGKVFPINVPAYRTLEGYVIKHYLEHCISAIRSKITEFRNRFPERHVVLVGWGVGALVSCKVANLDKVDAIVCLGFPYNGIDGDASEDYWKGLTKIECPILFFIGTHAATNAIGHTEKLRMQMKTQTNLILIESADELLRLTKSEKKSLGMTQNMIDKLIQDEIYLFLKSVLFKPKPAITHLPKGPGTGKKRKKKVESTDKTGAKKKKKSHVKATSKNIDDCSLPPLDVSISSESSIPFAASQGLLTTGSISTAIPVTQLQSESLTNFTSTVVPQAANIGDVVSSAKEVIKRTVTKEPKEKTKRSKKKCVVSKCGAVAPVSQKITSNMGIQRSANTIGHPPPAACKTNVQHPVTFQRVPAGSFVLSGASGQVRLQGGANILYLQQATSGTTQLLGAPIINTTSGAFTAVISSSFIGVNSPKINIVPSSNFKSGLVLNPALTPHSKGLSAIISSGGCGNLVFTSTTAQLLASTLPTSGDVCSTATASGDSPMSPTTALSNASDVNTSTTITSPNVASATANVPSTSSTIMTHLSANDLRYLANLIAKHSNSRPNSPMPTSVGTSPSLLNKMDEKTSLKACRENTDVSKSPITSTCISEIGNNVNKSSLISILDKKTSINPLNQSTKKVGQPPSLAQRVASIQQKDTTTKMKTPRMKSSKLTTTTLNMPMGHIITTNTTKMSSVASNSKVLNKVPVTLTIPISRLPSTLNFSSASSFSKAINVPVLSSYLSQDKFVLTSTKSSGSSPSSRAILTNPTVSKKSPIMIGNVPVCSSPGRMNMTVFPSCRVSTPSACRTTGGGIFITKTPFSSTISPFKSPIKGKNPSPITLHLPSQAALKDPKVLRKAVSDVKVIGVLSQQSKSQIPSLVNLSALRSISNPASPMRSPTNDSLHGDITPEELSPIHPREHGEISETKPEDRKRASFSPLKSSIMAAIGDNFKPLTPPAIPSSTLLAASLPRTVNVLGKSNSTGKLASSAFLGKLFVGPKSIVEPMRGKVTLQRDGNLSAQITYFDDEDTDDDESDVDFAISPAVDTPLANIPAHKPTTFDPIKHSNITKIVYAPNQTSNSKSNLGVCSTDVFSRNIIDVARAKLRETHFKGSVSGIVSPNMGISTLRGISEQKSSLGEHSSSIGTIDSKLRFEPLKVSNTRAKLTSVLSMRENRSDEGSRLNTLQNNNTLTNPAVDLKTGVLVGETRPYEHAICSNIVTVQSSKHPTTSVSFSLKPTFHPSSITNLTSMCDPQSRHLFEKSGGLSQSSVAFSPNVSVTPLSVEASDRANAARNEVSSHEIKETQSITGKGLLFSNMETTYTQSSVDTEEERFLATPFSNIDTKGTSSVNIDSKGTSSADSDTKVTPSGHIDSRRIAKQPKATKQSETYEMVVEEEPQPYVTRSGRVMRSKYAIQYIDELDRKKTSKKRRLSASTSQDILPLNNKKSKMVADVSQSQSTVTLENLVEAAKLIKKESDSLVNGGSVLMEDNSVNHLNVISDIDPTTNIAATAMLELLSADTKFIKDGGNVDGKQIKEGVHNTGSYTNEVVLNFPSQDGVAVNLRKIADTEVSDPNCVIDTTSPGNALNTTKMEIAGHEISEGTISSAVISEDQSSNSTHLSVMQNKSTERPKMHQGEEVEIGKLNVRTPIKKSPEEQSLPTLAPIQHVPTEMSAIPTANLEPLKENVEKRIAVVDDVNNVATNDCAETSGVSPIPRLAAIQDNYIDTARNMSIALLNTVKRCETSLQENNIVDVASSILSKKKDNKFSIHATTVVVEPPPLRIDVPINGTAFNITPAEKCLPTVAMGREKPNMEKLNDVVCCADVLFNQTKTDSVVTPSNESLLAISQTPHKHLEGGDATKNENQITMDQCSDDVGKKEVVLTVHERVGKSLSDDATYPATNFVPKPPHTSLPALAVIQNKVHANLSTLSERNLTGGPKLCNPKTDLATRTITADTQVNSLPPLAAIQINPPDCTTVNKSDSADLTILQESNKLDILKPEKEGLVLLSAAIQNNDMHVCSETIPTLYPVTKTDIFDTTKELIFADRTAEIATKLTDEESKRFSEE